MIREERDGWIVAMRSDKMGEEKKERDSILKPTGQGRR
jgi:hypothetical protein